MLQRNLALACRKVTMRLGEACQSAQLPHRCCGTEPPTPKTDAQGFNQALMRRMWHCVACGSQRSQKGALALSVSWQGAHRCVRKKTWVGGAIWKSEMAWPRVPAHTKANASSR